MQGQGVLKIETEIKNSQSRIRNILIVDDIENNRILLEELLTGSGYDVVSAINGRDALEKLNAGREYDLVISDILMPVMDGFKLCESMKRDKNLRNIPFVFSTASFIEENDEALALRLGAITFIRKPFDPGEFLKIVHGLLKDVDGSKINTQELSLEDDKEVHRLQ